MDRLRHHATALFDNVDKLIAKHSPNPARDRELVGPLRAWFIRLSDILDPVVGSTPTPTPQPGPLHQNHGDR